MKLAFKRYFDWEIETAEFNTMPKTISHQRLSSIHWTEYNDELKDIIAEHNELIKQFDLIESCIMTLQAKIFSKNKPKTK